MDEVFWIDLILLSLGVVAAVAVVTVRDLLSATMLAGIYSLLMALVWVNLAAMDVGFTEAAVGAGITTILYIGALVHTGRTEKPNKRKGLHWPALVAVVLTGAALAYGTIDMPAFGDASAPIHTHVAPEYIEQRVGKITEGTPPDGHENEGDFGHHVPNLVTAVLADYRGYDTLFETAVIFTAGISLILLLRRPSSGKPREENVR